MTYATPVVTTTITGATKDRNAKPTMSTIAASVNASTLGSDSRMMSPCSALAGTDPVTPTKASDGPKNSSA
jgi:hypothetical protein